MPAWATFAGFAFVVTTGLLLLSYASRGAIPDDEPAVSLDEESGASSDEESGASSDEESGISSDEESGISSGDQPIAAHDAGGADHHDVAGAGRHDDVNGTSHHDDVNGTSHHDDDPVSDHAGAVRGPIPESRSTSAERAEAPDVGPGPLPADADSPPATPELARGPPDLSTGALLANVALSQGLFGVLLLAGAWYAEIPAWAFGVTPDTIGPEAIALGAVFGVALYAANEAGAALGAQFDLGGGERLRRALAPETPLGWATLLLVVLPIIAGFEELLFRGALIGVMAAGFEVSPWLLAVLSSGAFALGHGAQGRLGVVVTGALGFVLAAGYIVTGSLLVVAVAHYLVNALEFLVHEGLGVEWPPEAD
ncbi:CPBP family intramembrane glutamic endopeptidase [Halobellus ordinarius]|uniref:CPBP family intramembrane glutamic endopeptidase n=1 Tax=Halobellus ordinarius TaxID=3075120 RepID=UPI002880B217|nr:CPBP family glutamic-type intramembrane protease [Halobellus sp. ZY16]